MLIFAYTKKDNTMAKETIKQFIERMISQYSSREAFKTDLDRMILDLTDDGCSPHQLAYYKRVRNKFNKMFA
jgi:hypothetical protein